LSDEKPTWESPMINKQLCYWCQKRIKPIDPSTEISLTTWINGYWTQSQESRYFCQECSKDGFTVTPVVTGK